MAPARNRTGTETLSSGMRTPIEQYELNAKRHQGSFPQASNHVGLIYTAFNLTRGTKPAKKRADGCTKPDAMISRPEPSSTTR
jgi:hypothetical protein